MTDYTVSSGVTLSGSTLSSGNVLTVMGGGSAVSTLIQAGGLEYVSSGGVVSGETISGGEYLSSGATATADSIGAGGYLAVEIGAVANLTIVGNQGALDVYGSAVGIMVNNGGTEDVFSGVATGTIVNSNGEMAVFSGGIASGAQIGSGGMAYVMSGGSAIGSIVSGGGYELVSSGGTATGTMVLGGGGADYVQSGGVVSSATIGSGGAQVIFSGGVAIGTVISSGGIGFVHSSGTASGTDVLQGGALIALPGAEVIAAGGQVISTGVVELSSEYAMISYQTAPESGGSLGVGNEQYVLPGGTAVGITVSAGSTERLYAGGTADSAYLYSGGLQIVSSGGQASSSVVHGGTEYVVSGGTATSAILIGGGQELVTLGGLAQDTQLASGGVEYVYSGGITSGATVSKTGALYILSGAIDSGSQLNSGGVEFIYSGGTASNLTIEVGGAIDLASLPYISSGAVSLDRTTDVLTITEGGSSSLLQLAGDYTTEGFTLTADGTGGSLVTANSTPCYCRGTMILTDQGEVAVEDLAIGDVLITQSGMPKPVRWIGRRAYGGRFAAANPEVLPILIHKGTLALQVPHRDLLISPQHALMIDGLLIPARALVNGGSIIQQRAVDEIEYFHVELESHDVIIANGVPAESFLDDQNRFMFHNAAEYDGLYPHVRGVSPQYCALRLSTGPVVAAIRKRLTERGEQCGYLPPGSISVPLSVGNVSIVVPPKIGGLRLISPFGMAGRDERWLGALLAGITIDGVAVDLTDARLAEGFNDLELHEGRKVRWTTGDALINLDPAPVERICEFTVAAVMDEGSRPNARFTIRIDAPGTIRAIVPAGVSELRLISSSGRAGGDIRQLGALIGSIILDDEPLDPADAAFGQGFHELEIHGDRPVRWTDGDALLAIAPRPVGRWCEIEAVALSAPEHLTFASHSITIEAAGLIDAVIPAGVDELRLISTAACVPGDIRRLGALITGLAIGDEVIDPADERFAEGFYQPERHKVGQGTRVVRWTDGDGVIMLQRSPVERRAEIEVAALMGSSGLAANSA